MFLQSFIVAEVSRAVKYSAFQWLFLLQDMFTGIDHIFLFDVLRWNILRRNSFQYSSSNDMQFTMSGRIIQATYTKDDSNNQRQH